jgi:hypothetical protein
VPWRLPISCLKVRLGWILVGKDGQDANGAGSFFNAASILLYDQSFTSL